MQVSPPERSSSSAANFVSKTQRPKDEEQPRSCDCTSGSATEEASVEHPPGQAVACALLARNIRRCEPKSRTDSVKKSLSPRLNRSKRPPTKYNRWTLPPSSHPLSERRYSALYYVQKGAVESASEGETTESQGTCSCVPESSLCEVERREEEPASQDASAIFPSGPSVKPVTPSTDSIEQHCRVNMDTDFIANFSYAFIHGNNDSRDNVSTCHSQITTVKLDTDIIANINYDFMHDDII